MEPLAVFLIEYAFVPELITGLYAALVYRKLTVQAKNISYFIFFSCIIEIISKILWYRGENNLPLLHLYVLVGFLLIIRFYRSVLVGFIHDYIFLFVTISFALFTVVNSLFFETIFNFNSTALSVQAVLLIIFSIFTFIVLMNDIVKDRGSQLHPFLNWINSGVFVYYLSSLMVFYFGKLLIADYSSLINQYLWGIHVVFLMVMYCCFFIGLWKSPKVSN
jgi:hypothetical protein